MKVVVACLVLTGCFYIDPINRRPRLDPISCRITNADRTCSDGGYLHRSDDVELTASLFDPDGDVGYAKYRWSGFACTDLDAKQCDLVPYSTSDSVEAKLGWPNNASGVRSLRIDLEVRDDRGARVDQAAIFHVNDAPSLAVHVSERSHVAGVPLQLTATYDDLDEGPANLRTAWQVVSPVLDPPVALEDDASLSSPAGRVPVTVGKRLVPPVTGAWDIRVTATDALGETVEKHVVFDVGPDLPPCLVHVQPIVAPDGAALPIVEPTVFQVPLVDDDLDAYPRISGDPAFGTTVFAWSILPPGASVRQPLVGATGNSIDFDPAGFTPGQQVELRVEAFDRNRVAIACPDAASTCTSAARPQCTQRQTWRVEIR